jgi:hypothetical protein
MGSKPNFAGVHRNRIAGDALKQVRVRAAVVMSASTLLIKAITARSATIICPERRKPQDMPFDHKLRSMPPQLAD